MLKRGPEAIVEVGGMKSANTHLHLMEAFTELAEATRDPEVRKSVAEAVKINALYFYPPKAGESCFHRHLDWAPATEPTSAGLSYGHNVEFAWLLIRAQTVLGQAPSWDHFNAHIEHALKYGYDHQRGGLASGLRWRFNCFYAGSYIYSRCCCGNCFVCGRIHRNYVCRRPARRYRRIPWGISRYAQRD